MSELLTRRDAFGENCRRSGLGRIARGVQASTIWAWLPSQKASTDSSPGPAKSQKAAGRPLMCAGELSKSARTCSKVIIESPASKSGLHFPARSRRRMLGDSGSGSRKQRIGFGPGRRLRRDTWREPAGRSTKAISWRSEKGCWFYR